MWTLCLCSEATWNDDAMRKLQPPGRAPALHLFAMKQLVPCRDADVPYCNSLVNLDLCNNRLTALGNMAGYPMLHDVRWGNNSIHGSIPSSLADSPLLVSLAGELSGSVSEHHQSTGWVWSPHACVSACVRTRPWTQLRLPSTACWLHLLLPATACVKNPIPHRCPQLDWDVSRIRHAADGTSILDPRRQPDDRSEGSHGVW